MLMLLLQVSTAVAVVATPALFVIVLGMLRRRMHDQDSWPKSDGSNKKKMNYLV